MQAATIISHGSGKCQAPAMQQAMTTVTTSDQMLNRVLRMGSASSHQRRRPKSVAKTAM